MSGRQERQVNVLVTGAGGITGVSVLRALRAADDSSLCVVSADCAKLVAGHTFADRAVMIPAAHDDAFADALLGACLRERIDLVIPTIDVELPPLSHARRRFEEHGVRVAVSSPECVEILDDKILSYRFFVENDIPTPDTSLLHENAKVSGPVLLKPRRGCGARGIVRLDGPRDIAWAREKYGNDYMLQTLLSGDEFAVDVIAARDGTILSAVARQRIVIKAGVTYIGRTVDDRRIIEQAVEIARRLELFGPASLQCIRDHDDGLFWTEGNPRFSGGLSLTVGAGVNGPCALIQWVRTGEFPELPAPKIGLTMLRHWTETYVDP